MNKVQTALNEYFNSKGFFKTVMNIDYIWYGLGALLLFVGAVFAFPGSNILAILGLYLFWAGVVVGFAKKNDIGLTIAFGAYILTFFVSFIISFVKVFTVAAVMLTGVFADLIHIAVATLLLICVIKRSEYYARHLVLKQQQAAAYAAAQAQAAAYAATQVKAGYTPPSRACSNCGNPLAPDALFCPKCGARHEIVLPPACPSCGAELKEGAVFCVKCGAKV